MDNIDAIRGIAALAVVYFHIAQYFIKIPGVAAHGDFLSEVSYQLNLGFLGVLVFFAISGFVICPTLKGERSNGVRRFIISRFFRLFPAFWASMLLMLLAGYLFLGKQVDVSQVLGNIPMLFSFFRVDPVISVYWTLEVELIFYFLCLILFLLGGLHKPLVLFTIGMILMGCSEWIYSHPEIREQIRTTTGTWYWMFLPWNLAIMVWGGLFRIWYDDRSRRTIVGGYSVSVLFLAITLFEAILLRPVILIYQWILDGRLGAIHNMAPFLGLVLFVVGALYIKLNNRFLVWLGTISYSIYLLHLVALKVVVKVRADSTQWMDFHLGVYLLFFTVVSIVLAALVYYSVEKPAIRLGRYLQKRWA
jgi:peptidoglycan/LPS O-acetylase OafA/YrhL